jgi:hypothetical protein
MAADDPWLVHMQRKGMKPYLKKLEGGTEIEHAELCEKQDGLSACAMMLQKCVH